jgi:hypothetical protein
MSAAAMPATMSSKAGASQRACAPPGNRRSPRTRARSGATVAGRLRIRCAAALEPIAAS